MRHTITNITSFKAPVFRKRVVETIIFVVRAARSENTLVDIALCDNNRALLACSSRNVAQETFVKAHKNVFLVKATARDMELKKKLDRVGSLLGGLVHINQAIALKHDRSKSLSKRCAGPNYKRVLDGRNIGRYDIHWDGTYLNYDVANIHSSKRPEIFEEPEKLLFRRVGDRLTFAYDDQRFYALNTLVVVTKRQDDAADLLYLLGLLNSALLNYYYFTFLKSTKKTFSEIQARQLARVPIVIPKEGATEELRLAKKVRKYASNMIDCQKQFFVAKTPDERARLQRRFRTLDRQIDALVIGLYRLSESDIQVVQSSSSPQDDMDAGIHNSSNGELT